VTELLAEFSSSAYRTDPKVSRLKWLPLTPEGHKRAGEVAKKLALRDNRYINKEL
jgi:hypothetical protein